MISGVSGAPAHAHELHVGRQRAGRAQQVRQALLTGDPADEHDRGAVGVDAERRTWSGSSLGFQSVRSMPL